MADVIRPIGEVPMSGGVSQHRADHVVQAVPQGFRAWNSDQRFHQARTLPPTFPLGATIFVDGFAAAAPYAVASLDCVEASALRGLA